MAEIFTNDASGLLAASVGVSDTTLPLTSASQFPTTGTFRIRVDDEVMTVTSVAGNVFTVTRASEICMGVQTAAAHAAGTSVYDVLTAGSLATISGGAGSGTVTSISTGTGLSGGPITTSGTVSLANTAVRAGVYTNTNLTVDAQGRLTAASNGSAAGVTSVAITVPTELSVAGSPITTSGTLAVTWATESANKVFSGPSSGGATTPAFRSLVSSDIPALSYVTSAGVSGGTTGLTTSGGPITTSGTITISGILIAANGGLGSDTSGYTSGQIPVAQGAGSYSADSRRGLYTGNGVPSAGTGFPGDYYIDLSTTPNAIYLKS